MSVRNVSHILHPCDMQWTTALVARWWPWYTSCGIKGKSSHQIAILILGIKVNFLSLCISLVWRRIVKRHPRKSFIVVTCLVCAVPVSYNAIQMQLYHVYLVDIHCSLDEWNHHWLLGRWILLEEVVNIYLHFVSYVRRGSLTFNLIEEKDML